MRKHYDNLLVPEINLYGVFGLTHEKLTSILPSVMTEVNLFSTILTLMLFNS